jgi:hypothetical protein
VDAARAGEDGAGRQVGRGQPLLDARGERVDPADAPRLRAQASRRTPGQQRLGAAEQLVAGLGLQRNVLKLELGVQAGGRRAAEIGVRRIGPQQNRALRTQR